MQTKLLLGMLVGLFGTSAFAVETCSNIDSLSTESVISMARANQLGKCRLFWENRTMIIQVTNDSGVSSTAWSVVWPGNNEAEAFARFPSYNEGIRAAAVLKDFFKAGICQKQ